MRQQRPLSQRRHRAKLNGFACVCKCAGARVTRCKPRKLRMATTAVPTGTDRITCTSATRWQSAQHSKLVSEQSATVSGVGTHSNKIASIMSFVVSPFGRRIGWLCLLAGRRPEWKPHPVAASTVCVSMRVATRWSATKLEATFGRRSGCLCRCVLLPADRRPKWKPRLVAKLAVCFSVVVAANWLAAKLEATLFAEFVACVPVCCYLLAGDHNGNHIRSPNWLLLTGRRRSLKPHLVATFALCVAACCCPLAGDQNGNHTRVLNWMLFFCGFCFQLAGGQIGSHMLIAELAVCVAVCCCSLSGGSIAHSGLQLELPPAQAPSPIAVSQPELSPFQVPSPGDASDMRCHHSKFHRAWSLAS